MGKINNALSVVAIILGSVGTLSAGGAVAYDVINQPQDGVDGKNGNLWHVGVENIDTVAIGNEGDFYYDTDDYKLYQVENGSWVLKIEGFGQAGATGAQGVQGEKGDKGDQGVQGIQGVQGEQGEQGIQGIQGVQGEKGDQGIQGIQGVQGEKGDQGIQGIQGIQGEPGVKGDPGDKGNTGDKGDPGTNGTNGTDGTSYYSWIKFSDAMPSSDADMKDSASNFIGIYSGTSSTAPTTYSSYTWFEIKGAKGNTGDKGETGPKGDAGQDGKSVYVGYDGYIWSGTVKSNLKLGSIGKYCTENTLELYSNNYFTKELVDTTTNAIALTGEYYENINKFIYSNLALDKMTVYAETAGDLVIGTINLSTGNIIDSKKYTVTSGKNVIDLSDVTVGTNETIVIGGGDTTVKLYKATGVNNVTDTYGNFTVVPNLMAPASITVDNSKTEEVLDKLICKVEILGSTVPASTKLLPNVVTDAGAISSMKVVDRTCGPYKYETNYFSGKTITKLGVAVKESNNGTILVYVVNKDQTKNYDTTYNKKYIIELNCAKNANIDAWVYTDVNIVVGENETLAFDYNDEGTGEGANWLFQNTKTVQNTYDFWINNGNKAGQMLTFDIEAYTTSEYSEINLDVIREALAAENAE